MDDILKDYAVRSLNLTDEKFAELTNSDDKETVLNELLKLDAERIANAKKVAKERETELHDKGYKKAQAESLSKFEKELKDEFGVAESTLQGKDLVKEIISKISKDANLDDNKVKLHPLYRQLEAKLGSDYIEKAEYEKVLGEFDGYKSQVEKDKVLGVVKKDGIAAFRALNPVLSKDPVKALNQENDFMNKLAMYEFEVQPDGNHIIKDGGKRKENAQGYAVKFSDFIKEQASMYFDFAVQTGRQNAGNEGGGGSNAFKTPTNDKEYTRMMAEATSKEERMALLQWYKDTHK